MKFFSHVKRRIRNNRLFKIFDTIYKSISYGDFYFIISEKLFAKRIARCRQAQQYQIRILKGKKRLTVAFFMQSPSVWKYDHLYKLMARSDKYEPIVVVSPYNVHLMYDRQECMDVLTRSEAFAKANGYRYMVAYDKERHQWRNIRNLINPDIVFFCKPYKDTVKQCHLYSYQDLLTCYVPYGIPCFDNYKPDYNLPFHNFLWKFFVETDFQKKEAERLSFCHGDNVITVGSLGTEALINKDYHHRDVWKPQASPKKRIIWAPHHTVDYLFNFSNFLVYCDYILELAQKYKDTVQFAFKPHPVLKFKLINLWGREKTEAYYNRWQAMENTQIEEGEYMDLFLSSDAMIHDCVSFTVEYLYTNKPALFLLRNDDVLKQWSQFGKRCYDMHYIGRSETDIETFINDVVINNQDKMRAQRQQFIKEYLIIQDGMLPSERLLTQIDNILTPKRQ